MNATLPLAAQRAPTIFAVGLLIVFAAAVLFVLKVPAFTRDLDSLISLCAFPPWFVGPAAWAALLVALARSKGEAWSFVVAEAAAVASTVGLYAVPAFFKAPRADAVDTIVLIALPVAQVATLLVYAAGTIAVADFVLARDPEQQPRKMALTMLSIAAVAMSIVVGWLVAYLVAL